MAQGGELDRPLAIAVTVINPYLSLAEDHLHLMGPFHLYSVGEVAVEDDTTAMRISLEHLDPMDFSGPAASPLEKSSVRMSSASDLFSNISAVAFRYGLALLRSERTAEAYEIAEWLEWFESESRGEVIHGEEIRQMKAAAESSGM